MRKMMTCSKILVTILLLICFCLIKEDMHAESESGGLPRLLLVIDRSKSLQAEEKSIKQSLDMLFSFIRERGGEDKIDIIVFDESAEYIALKNLEDIMMNGAYTDIVQALKLADGWVQERISSDERGYVIVISDLLEDKNGNFTIEDAKGRQGSIDQIVSAWRKDKHIEYSFITWKNTEDAQYKQVKEYENDGIKKVDKFYCDVQKDKKIILDLQNEEAGKTVSNVKLTGELLKRILEVWTDVSASQLRGYGDGGKIKFTQCYEAYILMDKNGSISSDEAALCITDDMKLYSWSMVTNKKEIEIDIPQDISERMAYYFYLPMDKGTFLVTSEDKKVGKNILIEYNSGGEYKDSFFEKPLKVVVYQKNGEEREVFLEEEMLKGEQDFEYRYTLCFEEAGTYLCEIRTADNKLISRIKTLYVDESNAQVENESKGEVVNAGFMLVLTFVASGLFIVIVCWLSKKKG